MNYIRTSKKKLIVLSPLIKRMHTFTTDTEIITALERLDSIAGSSDLVDKFKDDFQPRKNGELDTTRIKNFISFIRALYDSRRIALFEYIYFASAEVHHISEERWMQDEYQKELEPISQAMEKIEKEYGLGKDEFFPLKEAPPEHSKLNKEYEKVLNNKFIETLVEFGLDDLATMAKQNWQEFNELSERGRRSVFHGNEFVPALKDIVLQYERDAEKAASAHAYFSAITCLGAGIEGLLLLRCLQSKNKACRIAQSLPNGKKPMKINQPNTWDCNNLIEVCLKAGWLPLTETEVASYRTDLLAVYLKNMRNFVHPGRYVKKRPWAEIEEREYRDALAVYKVLNSALSNTSKNKKKNQLKKL